MFDAVWIIKVSNVYLSFSHSSIVLPTLVSTTVNAVSCKYRERKLVISDVRAIGVLPIVQGGKVIKIYQLAHNVIHVARLFNIQGSK